MKELTSVCLVIFSLQFDGCVWARNEGGSRPEVRGDGFVQVTVNVVYKGVRAVVGDGSVQSCAGLRQWPWLEGGREREREMRFSGLKGSY